MYDFDNNNPMDLKNQFLNMLIIFYDLEKFKYFSKKIEINFYATIPYLLNIFIDSLNKQFNNSLFIRNIKTTF